MSKPPSPNDEIYYAEVSYVVNEQMGVFDRVPKAQIRIIGAKFKGPKVGYMVTITLRVIIFDMETTTATTTSRG